MVVGASEVVGASVLGAAVVASATVVAATTSCDPASFDPPPPHDTMAVTANTDNITLDTLRMTETVGDWLGTTRTKSMDQKIRLVPTLLVGVAAGTLSGLFGVGGGILVVPALVVLLRFDQRFASGTSLGAVFPISIASLFTYWGHGNVDWPMALWLTIGAVTGAMYGTKLIHRLPRRTLGLLFATVLIITAIRLYLPAEADGRSDLSWQHIVALVAIGFATGVLAGLLGIGGGVIMVPVMIVLFGEIPVIAKGTAVAVTSPTALFGTWRNLKNRNIDGRVAVIVGLAGIPTAVLGGTLADHMSKTLSNALFATLVLTVAVKMLWDLRRDSTS